MDNRISAGATLGALMTVVLGAAPAAFAQVCVDPAGGGCQATIQDGVDLATAGQTVTVAPAVYRESVLIPDGKDGLKVVGDGAIIDNPSNQNAFEVLSNDVTLSGFLIRNGRYGVFVGDESFIIPHGTTLDGLSFDRTRRSSVYLAGADDTTVTDCRFAAAGDRAVEGVPGSDSLGADRTTVTRSRFAMCDNGCVSIEGNTALVSGNKFTQAVSDPAVDLLGDDAQAIKNSVTRSSGGVSAEGASPVVTGNKVSAYSGSPGVGVYCTSDCPNGLVSGNKVANAPDDTAGFRLFTDEAGLLVTKNSSSGTSNEGFNVDGVGITLTGNRVSNIGGDDYESGVEVYGEGHTITGNSATGAIGTGILIRSNASIVSGNTVSGNYGDGFQYRGFSGDPPCTAQIQGNTATENIGEGFAVAGDNEDYSGVVLSDNVSDSNRVPFCSNAPLVGPTDGGGNNFTIAGSPACVTSR